MSSFELLELAIVHVFRENLLCHAPCECAANVVLRIPLGAFKLYFGVLRHERGVGGVCVAHSKIHFGHHARLCVAVYALKASLALLHQRRISAVICVVTVGVRSSARLCSAPVLGARLYFLGLLSKLLSLHVCQRLLLELLLCVPETRIESLGCLFRNDGGIHEEGTRCRVRLFILARTRFVLFALWHRFPSSR
eukprot:05718_1